MSVARDVGTWEIIQYSRLHLALLEVVFTFHGWEECLVDPTVGLFFRMNCQLLGLHDNSYPILVVPALIGNIFCEDILIQFYFKLIRGM